VGLYSCGLLVQCNPYFIVIRNNKGRVFNCKCVRIVTELSVGLCTDGSLGWINRWEREDGHANLCVYISLTHLGFKLYFFSG